MSAEQRERLALVPPDESWAAAVWDYRAEFEAVGDALAGTADLGAAADFSRWMAGLRADAYYFFVLGLALQSPSWTMRR